MSVISHRIFESHGRLQPGKFGDGCVDHKIKKCTEAIFIYKREDDRGISVINEYLPIVISDYIPRVDDYDDIVETVALKVGCILLTKNTS